MIEIYIYSKLFRLFLKRSRLLHFSKTKVKTCLCIMCSKHIDKAYIVVVVLLCCLVLYIVCYFLSLTGYTYQDRKINFNVCGMIYKHFSVGQTSLGLIISSSFTNHCITINRWTKPLLRIVQMAHLFWVLFYCGQKSSNTIYNNIP